MHRDGNNKGASLARLANGIYGAILLLCIFLPFSSFFCIASVSF
jgi:hypothetical protein